MTPETIHLEPWVLPLLAGTIIPVLTGVVTRFGAHSGVKAATSIVLAWAAATGIEVINWLTSTDGTFEVRAMVALFLVTFTTQVVTYFGLWKPTGAGAAPGARVTKGWIG